MNKLQCHPQICGILDLLTGQQLPCHGKSVSKPSTEASLIVSTRALAVSILSVISRLKHSLTADIITSFLSTTSHSEHG